MSWTWDGPHQVLCFTGCFVKMFFSQLKRVLPLKAKASEFTFPNSYFPYNMQLMHFIEFISIITFLTAVAGECQRVRKKANLAPSASLGR